jgi:uncharacterized protein (DUF305 family)
MQDVSQVIESRYMRRVISGLVVVAAASLATAAAQAPPQKKYTPADVHFMSGMIYHHAQAILIAGWATSHGASPTVQTLCDRIVASQKDEINLMSNWLRARGEPVPHPEPEHMMMPGMGMDSTHMMPGMLTQAQLAQLDSTRGTEFDETFLRLMIQHHQGAITMVNQLFAASGGEEEPVYKIATGIFADQTTEIERMQRMLANDLFGPTTPK